MALIMLALFSSCGHKNATAKVSDTLVLQNGGMITGTIVQESPDRILMRLPEGEVTFSRSEIAEVRRGEKLVDNATGIQTIQPQATADTDPYPRLYLKSGGKAVGTGLRKEGETFYLKQRSEGGGTIEFSFPAGEVERIELWPPEEKGIPENLAALRKKYPKFSLLSKPPYYFLSDAEASDMVQYVRAFQHSYQDFLLNFFEFLDLGTQPKTFGAVIFSNQTDFYAEGQIPQGSNIVGFYRPDNSLLYLFNAKETQQVKFYFYRMESAQKRLDNFVEELERIPGLDSSMKLRIMGMKQTVNAEIERRQSWVEFQAREFTMGTIRHEGGHQLLHHLGVDSEKVYRGAWFSEGMACYLEPSNWGELNKNRLMHLRYELEQNQHLVPLQYLVTFRSGAGIHKLLDTSYSLLAYAESWALVYFLMSEPYRNSFHNYIRELKQQGKDFDAEKDRLLLEKHLGENLNDFEVKFRAFVDRTVHQEIDTEEYDYYRLFAIRN